MIYTYRCYDPAMDQARVELNRKLASKTEAQKQRYIEDGRI